MKILIIKWKENITTWIASGSYHSNIGLKMTSRDYLSLFSDKKLSVSNLSLGGLFPSYELVLVFQHLLLENIPPDVQHIFLL